MTQSALCNGVITRNMLSLIESGNALPSLETAAFLAERLSLPLAYLFSENDSLFVYEKAQKIQYIKELYKKKNCAYCMTVISSLSELDDELAYIYAKCAFFRGRECLLGGSLASASSFLNLAIQYCDKTFYSTDDIRAATPMYLAIAENIQSPLLEFDAVTYEMLHDEAYDFEFFKYITMDTEYEFSDTLYKRHLEAKALLKKYAYYDAIQILTELEEHKNRQYNACVLFGVYTDLENAYKQIGDFENAYRYSTKRMSLISGFQT